MTVVIGSVECAGNESHILECSHLTNSHEEVINCDSSEVAGVACQGNVHFLKVSYRSATYHLFNMVNL